MTVYGDGKQTRSFQYVSDLVRISSGVVGYLFDCMAPLLYYTTDTL